MKCQVYCLPISMVGPLYTDRDAVCCVGCYEIRTGSRPKSLRQLNTARELQRDQRGR